MNEIIASSVALLRTRMDQKLQVLSVRVSEALPLVMADELRVKQILLNLLTNAHKFTDKGGRIFVVATANDDDSVTVAVSDTGRGMSADDIVHALKPFVQIQSAYSREQDGTGLGLPIAKALVERHGGKFHIDSTPGAGTTVAFTLPTRRVETGPAVSRAAV